MTIKFKCDSCDNIIESKHILPGEKIGCLKCGELSTVPVKEQEEVYQIIQKNIYVCSSCKSESDQLASECLNCSSHFSDCLIECPSCKTQNRYKAKFCKNCGEKLQSPQMVSVKFCEKCKVQYDIEDIFCETDGNKLILIEVELSSPLSESDTSYQSMEDIPEEAVASEFIVKDKMDRKKAAELVGYNRKKARALGIMIWPITVLFSIVGIVFWGWIAIIIVFISAIVFGSSYSFIQSKHLQKITGRTLNELETLYLESAAARGDLIAQDHNKYKEYIDSLPD